MTTTISGALDDGSTFAGLANKIAICKSQEAELIRERKSAEHLLAELAGFELPEGSATYEDEDHKYRVTITQPVTRKLDPGLWREAKRHLTRGQAKTLVREKYELNLKAVREFEQDDREGWLILSSALTVRPGRVAVKVERV